MTRRIAVTGASGYVGQFVMAELARRPVTVRVLTRRPEQFAGSACEVVVGALHDSAALAALVRGTDAVVHLAYQHVAGRYRGGEGADLPGWLDANLGGTVHLLTTARAAGVSQIVFLSSRAVFSRTEPGRVLDETHPVSPDTHYGAYKVAVEALLRSFAAVEGMSTTAVRATGVYGVVAPVDRAKWWRLICDVVAQRSVTTVRGGTEVHGEDVAQAIWSLLALPNAAPPIVHMSDLYVTTRQIAQLAQQIAGIDLPLPPEPNKAPTNILACNALADLGLQLGGREKLAATVDALVQAARRRVG